MDEFDKTSFEIELADLLEKYGVIIESDDYIGFYGDNVRLDYGIIITPESLRNGS